MSTASDRTEYRGRSLDRGIRKTDSLLEPTACEYEKSARHSPRRSIGLFDDLRNESNEPNGSYDPDSPNDPSDLNDRDDESLPYVSLPRRIMTLGRRYKESIRSNVLGNARRDSFHGYRTEKIQEEPGDDGRWPSGEEVAARNDSVPEEHASVDNSNANSATRSVSARPREESSPTESSSIRRPDISKSFEDRLLAAENLIKESKLRNLTSSQQFNPNLSCNYKDTDKCDKETLTSTSDPSSVASKRRSCIPSLRLRSGSLTRESGASALDYGKSAIQACPAEPGGRANRERSILSKLFRGSGKETEAPRDGDKKRRISRFLRPDFFDTPREESRYVKEKEERRAAENERRKSRFMRRKNESEGSRKENGSTRDEKELCKELKNEMNALQKDKLGNAAASSSPSSSFSSSFEDKSQKEDRGRGPKVDEGRGSSGNFLHSLERKLERLRSNEVDETTSGRRRTKGRGSRECSAPPVECSAAAAASTLPETKRTLSVEDLSPRRSNENVARSGAKGRMMGLFKTSAERSKRSPPESSDRVESLEEDCAASKIPTTRYAARTDDERDTRKLSERVASECQRSPPKEKTREDAESIAKGRKPFVDKRSREGRLRGASDSSTSPPSADKIKLDKANSSKRKSSERSSPRRVVENKHADSVGSENKKLIKTLKRNPLSSLVSRNSESVAPRIDKDNRDDVQVDKKIKKLVKSKEDSSVCGKDELDGSRKKRIVRVVRKIVKKSSDEKGKPEKKETRKGVTTKEEKSPEGPIITARGKEGNDPDDRTAAKSSCSKASRAKSDLPAKKERPKDAERVARNRNTNRTKTDIKEVRDPSDTSDASKFDVDASMSTERSSRANSQTCPNLQRVSSALPIDPSKNPSTARVDSSFNVCQLKQPISTTSSEQRRPSRANLRLDLSKIPQHAFRHVTPKRDSPKSDSPNLESSPAVSSFGSAKTDGPITKSASDKLMDSLSKMTHRANITGNKIIIDKPLRAKDVAELKRDVVGIIGNCVTDESRMNRVGQPSASDESKEEIRTAGKSCSRGADLVDDDGASGTTEEPTGDRASEILSPEEPEESFEFWSICSADLDHNRDPRSPSQSPSLYSPFARGNDSSESVIDRIRRRSFYSRFNDRKRPSLTVPPPGVSSLTLPRRFSFNGSRERERDKLQYSYRVPRTR